LAVIDHDVEGLRLLTLFYNRLSGDAGAAAAIVADDQIFHAAGVFGPLLVIDHGTRKAELVNTGEVGQMFAILAEGQLLDLGEMLLFHTVENDTHILRRLFPLLNFYRRQSLTVDTGDVRHAAAIRTEDGRTAALR